MINRAAVILKYKAPFIQWVNDADPYKDNPGITLESENKDCTVYLILEEKGCVEYVPTIDIPTGLPIQKLNNNVVTIIEKWGSLEDLQTHLIAPHMLAYKEKVKNLVDKVSLKVLTEA